MISAAVLALALAAGPKEEADLTKLHSLVNGPDATARVNAELPFATALRAKQLPVCAFVWFTAILKAGETHPAWLASLEQLLQLQGELNDQYLIPALVTKTRGPAWDRLSPAARSHAQYLQAHIAYRRGQLDEVLAAADAVDPAHADHPAAQYLKALALADPRFPRGPKPADAIAVLAKVAAAKDARVKGLATLALGRLSYGSGKYADAVAWYAKAKAFPQHQIEAVFEGAFAQWQANDVPGALAAARASNTAEAVILESQLLYFGMKYPEARTALERMKPEAPATNRRQDSVVALVAQVEREKALLAAPPWKGTPMAAELTTYLEQNGAVLVQVRDKLIENRKAEAARLTQAYADMAEIMRFEIALAEGGSVDPAIASLEKIIPKIQDGIPQKAELLFHLAELRREKALQVGNQPDAAKLQIAEAKRLLDVVVKEYPTYGRLAEVKEIRGALH